MNRVLSVVGRSRSAISVGMQVRLLEQHPAQAVGLGVVAHQADQGHVGVELGGLAGHVRRAAGHLVLVARLEDLDRCLGAEPRGPPLDVVVEHDVAHHRHAARPHRPDQPFQPRLGRVHRVPPCPLSLRVEPRLRRRPTPRPTPPRRHPRSAHSRSIPSSRLVIARR